MNIETTNFGFPFAIGRDGRISASGGDEAIRGKIIQVLFTAPGERVNLPGFGCGLFNLVFEPNDAVLAATIEFTVGQALTRWLADDILVEGIEVDSWDATVMIEIVYTRKADLARQAVRIHFK
jgi:phage baseplate assembly protein W